MAEHQITEPLVDDPLVAEYCYNYYGPGERDVEMIDEELKSEEYNEEEVL